ncbi:MAG: UDP-glucose 4-epimerase GalE [Candidatus Paceibacteria bacterium]
MKKTILVTGGAGYIGSACVQALIGAGHSVTVFDDFSTGQRDKVPAEAIIKDGDITDLAAVRAACGSAPFTTVMHFAAKKAVGESEANPALYFHTNVTGSLNLLTAMSEAAIPQLIFSSTAAVYAPPESDTPLNEEASLAPASVYGASKLITEQLVREFARTSKLSQYTILRYFNVAGDAGLNYQEQNAQNVFPILKTTLTTGTPFPIFGTDYGTRDGTCIRDYIHLSDLVTAHVRAVTTTVSDTFNLGTGTGYTVRELIAMFEQVSGKKMIVHESPRRAGDVAVVTASAAKAKATLGWSPAHTLEDMVLSTLET